MAETGTRKRNSDADLLLARVVDFAEDAEPSAAESRALCQTLADRRPWIAYGVKHQIAAWSTDEIAQLGTEIRSVLRQVIEARTDGGPVPTVPIAVEITPVPFPSAKRPGRVALAMSGSPRDVVWFHVLHLLQSVGLDKIVRCDCGRAVVKVGKRRYCSDRCQKRVYMREQRDAERQERIALESRRRRPHGKTTRTR